MRTIDPSSWNVPDIDNSKSIDKVQTCLVEAEISGEAPATVHALKQRL